MTSVVNDPGEMWKISFFRQTSPPSLFQEWTFSLPRGAESVESAIFFYDGGASYFYVKVDSFVWVGFGEKGRRGFRQRIARVLAVFRAGVRKYAIIAWTVEKRHMILSGDVQVVDFDTIISEVFEDHAILRPDRLNPNHTDVPLTDENCVHTWNYTNELLTLYPNLCRVSSMEHPVRCMIGLSPVCIQQPPYPAVAESTTGKNKRPATRVKEQPQAKKRSKRSEEQALMEERSTRNEVANKEHVVAFMPPITENGTVVRNARALKNPQAAKNKQAGKASKTPVNQADIRLHGVATTDVGGVANPIDVDRKLNGADAVAGSDPSDINGANTNHIQWTAINGNRSRGWMYQTRPLW